LESSGPFKILYGLQGFSMPLDIEHRIVGAKINKHIGTKKCKNAAGGPDS